MGRANDLNIQLSQRNPGSPQLVFARCDQVEPAEHGLERAFAGQLPDVRCEG
jgi:hypothetical protein